jgi:hypothetical protein
MSALNISLCPPEKANTIQPTIGIDDEVLK